MLSSMLSSMLSRKMSRRNAVAVFLASCTRSAWASSRDLDQYLPSPRATAVLLDISKRSLIAAGHADAAARALEPPGSAVKPLVLAALLESGRLKPDETFLCPRKLRIRERSFDCIHPQLDMPLTIDLALAYSCNCYVAHMAQRFQAGELARELERYGLGSRTGLFAADEAAGSVRPQMNIDDQRMQALGEQGIAVTAVELAMAYRLLAGKMGAPAMQPIRSGLEGAVEFGTAQNARIAGAEIAGKTGSAISQQGEPVAWFAGFLPSSAPKIALAVMLPGRSGGADAAPVARRIFEAYLAGAI